MIEVKNLVKKYGSHLAVDHLNFTVDTGQIYGFLGPNGAGKSTTMNIMTGYLGATEGEVLINGHNILEEPEAAKKCIGYLPEMPPLYTDMKVNEYLRFVAELKKIPKPERQEQIEKVMLMVKIMDVQDRLIKNLSKGYKQRVGLAQAILGFPEIIILDEPTSFLDIRHKLELLAILKKMVLEKQMTVIMSLQELDLAQKISDQVICVHGDHIEKYGAPEEIFTSDYIRRLYGITRGSYNAEFGCVEMEPPTGEPQVFVIGGNGSGIPVYRKLQRQGIPFATGILHTNDADYQVAKELAAETITEKPFQCISEENYRKALEVMEKCREVYCPLKDFGPVNEKNRELIKKAEQMGKLQKL